MTAKKCQGLLLFFVTLYVSDCAIAAPGRVPGFSARPLNVCATPSSQSSDSAMRLALALKAPIEQGLVEVEAVDRYIVIRLLEKDTFAPEAATLRPASLAVMASLRAALKQVSGSFTVAGYTDDVAISTPQYRSNWAFAAARSSTVIFELLKTGELAPERFTLVSYGATRPLLPNTSAENRARNRRVEIVIQQ